MAVARPAPGSTGMKVALIVFVVLTVASLTFTVIMYTQQADLQAAADSANSRYGNKDRELQEMRSQVSELGRQFLGADIEDATKLREGVISQLRPITSDQLVKKGNITEDSSVATVLQGLHRLYTAAATELDRVKAELDARTRELAEVNARAEARAKEFAETTQQLQERYAALEQQSQANQQAWNQQVEELKARLESASASASNSLAAERQIRQKLEQQLEQANQRMAELNEKLARFSPGTDKFSLSAIADGRVIRSVAGEGIVYISLGRRDRVQPGMPFSVYSRSADSPDQKEKATIEVTNVFDTTSEARVLSSTSNNPVIEGDIIANVVFDPKRQYNFVVAGDFDLNFDGEIDSPGGAGGRDVVQMIQKWGGKISETVDSSVDFVVLGSPPPVPLKPNDGDAPEVHQRYKDRAQLRAEFDAIRNEARALSIPVLTRSQFLRLIGQTVPANADEEEPTLSAR
jgi:hypothetical protein